MIKKLFLYLIILTGMPFLVNAVDAPRLRDPLGGKTFIGIINALIDAVIPVIMALAVFFLVLSGFKFLTAQGEPSKIKDAQETFKWTVIGVAIVVGAQLIIRVLMDILGGL